MLGLLCNGLSFGGVKQCVGSPSTGVAKSECPVASPSAGGGVEEDHKTKSNASKLPIGQVQ